MTESITIGMTPEQWQILINTLKNISENLPLTNYTLIGATDWYWVIVLSLAFSVWLGYIWRDLKSGQDKLERIIIEERKDRKEQIDLLWAALKECKAECCGRRKDDS